MEYIILWILSLFGLWSLISNILNSIYYKNSEGCFDITLTVRNQEDSIQQLINQLSRIELIGKIKVYDDNSTDSTIRILEEIVKNNSRVSVEKIHSEKM